MTFRDGRARDASPEQLGFIMQLRKVERLSGYQCALAWEIAFPLHELTQNAILAMCRRKVIRTFCRRLQRTRDQAQRQTILNQWLQARGIQSRVIDKVRQGKRALSPRG